MESLLGYNTRHPQCSRRVSMPGGVAAASRSRRVEHHRRDIFVLSVSVGGGGGGDDIDEGRGQIREWGERGWLVKGKYIYIHVCFFYLFPTYQSNGSDPLSEVRNSYIFCFRCRFFHAGITGSTSLLLEFLFVTGGGSQYRLCVYLSSR